MTDLAVYINPKPRPDEDSNGVSRVVLAMYEHLPAHGITLVGSPEQADIVAAHITADELPRVDVLHCHGLYWTGDPGSGLYASWCHTANQKIIEAARQAYAVTVPSPWVAECFKRDMRLVPDVIGHGIDVAAWEPVQQHQGYLLWNKNRAGDVCDPAPAVALAQRGLPVVTTFVRDGSPIPATLQVIGTLPHAEMKEVIRHAQIYLATTKETFGLGTLEAMAAGVPVLGYRWGGTADLVAHEASGYLVAPGDVDGLYRGAQWLRDHRDQASARAREVAATFSWDRVMAQYAALYRRVAEEKARERRGVSIVITNYNYGRYLQQAVESCMLQTEQPDEIIIVDDGSTDNSIDVLAKLFPGPQIHGHWDAVVGYKFNLMTITQQNQGVAAARNAGIAAATQAHIVCLDADDMLASTFVETLLPAMQRDRGLGIAYTGLGALTVEGRMVRGDWPPPFDWAQQSAPTNPPGNCIPSACMFRRDMWERAGGYVQIYAPGEDAEFWTRGLSVGFRAARITDEPLFHYRMHAGSASRTKSYRRVDDWHPWMRDGRYPMGAPARVQPLVRSYSEPVISVIIPVGPGHAKLLPAALDSLLGQTFREWEVIVVFDVPPHEGNNHGPELAKQIEKTYPFARLHHTMPDYAPAGAGKARNLGLDLARAPLVLFLDADDFLMPSALETMLKAYVQEGGQRYIYSDWVAINGATAKADQAPEYDQLLWTERGIHAVTALLPTEVVRLVGGFDETLSGWEDWDFYLKLAVAGMCGRRVPEPLLGYRQHTGQRRESSLSQKDALLAILRDRYGAYATGDEAMAGCGTCGGGGAVIMRARTLLEAQPAPAQPDEQAPSPGPSVAVLKHIGRNDGSITYEGNGGRTYRGGQLTDRYREVDPADVQRLLNSGDWELVSLPTAPQRPVEPAPAVADPTTGAVTPADVLALDTPEERAAIEQANKAAATFRQQQRRAVESVK